MDLNKFKAFCIGRREKYSAQKKTWENILATTPNKEENDLVKFYMDGAKKVAELGVMVGVFDKFSNARPELSREAILMYLAASALEYPNECELAEDFRRLCFVAKGNALNEIYCELRFGGYFEGVGF